MCQKSGNNRFEEIFTRKRLVKPDTWTALSKNEPTLVTHTELSFNFSLLQKPSSSEANLVAKFFHICITISWWCRYIFYYTHPPIATYPVSIIRWIIWEIRCIYYLMFPARKQLIIDMETETKYNDEKRWPSITYEREMWVFERKKNKSNFVMFFPLLFRYSRAICHFRDWPYV